MGKINFEAPNEPHPRNIYHCKPDIAKLVDEFPDFRQHTGVFKAKGTYNITLDYTDRDALRALTKVLMKRDFSLDIDLPNDKFVPIVPLRLNYLLWIEDLLENLPPDLKSKSEIHGIDIGKGASCLYSLLAAKKNGWKMLTSEADDCCFQYADHNIKENRLQNLVILKKVKENSYLEGLLDPEITYDFCMFNPPVFCVQDGQIMIGKRQVPGKQSLRLVPKDEVPDHIKSLVSHDGEFNFLMRTLVNDSKIFKNRIRIYSSMIGHRTTVDKLLPELFGIVGKEHVCLSPFTEGRLTRWGIAWTFDSNIVLSDKREQFKTLPDFKVVQQTWHNIALTEAVDRFKYILDCAYIMYEVIEEASDMCKIEITAFEDVYNLTNKNYKRQRTEIHGTDVKKMKTNDCSDYDDSYDTYEDNCSSVGGYNVSVLKGPCSEVRYSNKDVAVKAIALFRRSSAGQNTIMQVTLLSGSEKWRGLHQILEFLRNKWNE